MYVQCERCKTEYDFDDALVSERGTTVKCTSCGFQFKVRRSSEGASDKWTVTTKGGTKQVFTTLRELQKAILAKQIARSDLLARGDGPPRPLGTIAELEPFFDETAKRPSARPPGGSGGSSRPPPVAPTRKPLPSVSGPPRPKTDTLRPPDLGAAVPPPTVPQIQEASSPLARTIGALEASYAGPNPALVRKAHTPPPATVPDPVPVPAPIPPPQQQQRLQVQMATAAQPILVQPTPPPPPSETLPQIQQQPVAIATMQQQQALAPEMSSPLPPRAEQISMLDEGPPVGGLMDRGPKRRWGGWVVAIVLLAGIGAGIYFGRPYLMGGPKTASSAPLDPQTEAFVTDGERALQEGRLDDAKTFFDKASGRAPNDAHVLLDVARLETIRADLAWLDLRLGEDEAKKRQLEDLGGKALHAADAALAAAPDDLSANRSKLDALRIVGNLSEARNLAPKLKAIDGQPETAYVLAALDLAEPGPQYKLVIDRLRSASMGEGALGRAQALLIYALVKSGDSGGAKHEVDRLGSLLRPHPLIGALRAFVDKAPGPVALTDAGGDAMAVAVDVNNLPANGGNNGGGGGGGGDPRALISQAEAAKNKGDYAKAKDLYGKALAKSPNDSEALAGLGDVSHAQRDYANAQTYYKQALASNGSFIPALIGLGDVQWEQGDKTAAKATYKEIVDRFPEQAYPARVKQRLEGSAPAPDEPR